MKKRKNERGKKQRRRRRKKKKNVNISVDRLVDVEYACFIGIQHCSSFIVHIYANKCLPLL
jgi:transposase